MTSSRYTYMTSSIYTYDVIISTCVRYIYISSLFVFRGGTTKTFHWGHQTFFNFLPSPSISSSNDYVIDAHDFEGSPMLLRV